MTDQANVVTRTGAAPEVARFAELTPLKRAFLDSYISAYEKENLRVIGAGVAEDPAARPVIEGNHGYALAFVRCEPGKGAALHSHKTEEVFVPLNGKLIVTYGENGEREIELDPWDVVSIPVGTVRAFSNPNDFSLVILTLVSRGPEGNDRVQWHPDVLKEAEASGVVLDEQNNLVLPDG